MTTHGRRDDKAVLRSFRRKSVKHSLRVPNGKNPRGHQQELTKAKVKDASVLSLDCLRIAGAVLNRERVRLIAGPLVLWDDGVVYALISRGKVTLPDDSSPAFLLKALQQSGHPTVEVSEMTVIGGWTSGPIYRKGSVRISGWINVWHDVEQNRERVFVVADPDKLAVVRDIHEHFKIKP